MLISHDKVMKIRNESDQVMNKSNDVILNEEAIDKVKAKYGDVSKEDFEELAKDNRLGMEFNYL